MYQQATLHSIFRYDKSMKRSKHIWQRMPAAVRKPLVFMIGSSVIVAGIAMLVLPGPGWGAIFLGFAILATEFAFAERVRDWLIAQLKASTKHASRLWRKYVRKHRA